MHRHLFYHGADWLRVIIRTVCKLVFSCRVYNDECVAGHHSSTSQNEKLSTVTTPSTQLPALLSGAGALGTLELTLRTEGQQRLERPFGRLTYH